MQQFIHPSKDDFSLTAVLGALADPVRLAILRSLLDKKTCMSCSEASPCANIAKSTLSHHFRILREAGLIRTVKQGVENRNVLRLVEINERFPGLLKLVLKLSEQEK